MKHKKQKINLIILIAGAVILVALNYYYQKRFLPKPIESLSDLKYEKLITAKDRAPLPKPKLGLGFKLPILMYHHIGIPPEKADAVYKGLTVSPENFETQVKWLKESGYISISLNDIYLFSQKQFSMPRKPVVFTFDDGYEDVFTNALPILKKYGFTASFGIITQFQGTKSGNNVYATWDEIAGAFQAGNEIVCHTQNHFDGSNPKFTADYIFQNLTGCQNDIFSHLGASKPVLIYPYGHYTSTYIEQAKKAGFVLGITVHEGNYINLNDLMQVPRVRVHNNEDFELFKRLVSK